MGNTRKRIKRSKRVRKKINKKTMKRAKSMRKMTRTKKKKIPKKKTKQRGRGLLPDKYTLPEGNECRYKVSTVPGPREYRNQENCEKKYGCEWGEKFSAFHPMRDAKPRCHKSSVCDYKGYAVPCYLFKPDNVRHTDAFKQL